MTTMRVEHLKEATFGSVVSEIDLEDLGTGKCNKQMNQDNEKTKEEQNHSRTDKRNGIGAAANGGEEEIHDHHA